MPTIAEKRATYRRLHESGCFVLPNPWNVGTARYLQGLGFKALATTSSGFAHAQGFADGAVSRDMMLAHFREIAEATDVPVNADFEGGYADAPEDVAKNVRLGIETGVAGLSIEDSTGDPNKPLYDFDLALARVRAARAAIDKAGGDVVFTARSEGFICGRPDLDETIRRLKAFADAGADCLYAPGIKTREEIAAVVKAVAPKPVNFLMASATALHGEGPGRPRRAPHQPRRHARARRLDRLRPRRTRDRQRRRVHQPGRHHAERRTQQLLPRRSQARTMSMRCFATC